MSIRVVPGEDNVLVREGVRALLESYEDFEVVGAAADAPWLLAAAAEHVPDVFVTDIKMQDAERRRLERNIHDGAQQQLVALAVKLKPADVLIEHDAQEARELVGRLQGGTHAALEDLRDLARGIYPPLLADKGLAAALEAQARKSGLPVEVRADAIGRYPQDVEAAVYFSVLEALQNVAKYAEASSATVELSADADQLTFQVSDDGRGFDPDTTNGGSSLQGIADRMGALDGHVSITSAPGRGTTIEGRLPIPVGVESSA